MQGKITKCELKLQCDSPEPRFSHTPTPPHRDSPTRQLPHTTTPPRRNSPTPQQISKAKELRDIRSSLQDDSKVWRFNSEKQARDP